MVHRGQLAARAYRAALRRHSPDFASMQEGAGTPRSPMAGTRIASLASLSGEPSLGQRHGVDTGASRAWHGNRAQTTGKMESVDPLTFVTSRRAGWRRVPCATAACVGSEHHGPATAVLGSLAPVMAAARESRKMHEGGG